HAIFRKRRGGREETLPGFRRAAQLVQRNGTFDPATGFAGHQRDHAVGDGIGEIPLAAARVNFKAGEKHLRMKAPFEADLLKLFIGFVMIAQFEPALSGLEMVTVRRLECFHGLLFTMLSWAMVLGELPAFPSA